MNHVKKNRCLLDGPCPHENNSACTTLEECEYKKYMHDPESCVYCGTTLIRQSGCVTCPNCGWSACD